MKNEFYNETQKFLRDEATDMITVMTAMVNIKSHYIRNVSFNLDDDGSVSFNILLSKNEA